MTDILYLPFTVDPTSAHQFGGTGRLTITPSAPKWLRIVPHLGLDHATSCHTKQQNPALVSGTNGSMEQVAAVPLRSLHAAAWWLTGDSTSESLLALVRPLSPENWRSRRTTLTDTRMVHGLNLLPHHTTEHDCRDTIVIFTFNCLFFTTRLQVECIRSHSSASSM